jgi:SprT protein
MNTIVTPDDFNKALRTCTSETDRWRELCNAQFGINMKPFTVAYDIKGTTAGYAVYDKHLVRYNPTLLRENFDHFIAQTVPHEVIHHAARAKYGYRVPPHGYEWRGMMLVMGLRPLRCHSYDTSNVPTRLGKALSGSKTVSRNNKPVPPMGFGIVTDFDK